RRNASTALRSAALMASVGARGVTAPFVGGKSASASTRSTSWQSRGRHRTSVYSDRQPSSKPTRCGMRASHAASAVRRERWGRYAHSYRSARRERASLNSPPRPRSRPFLSYGITRRTAGCVSISGAAAGVVTTSTGPWRAASASKRGVVSTTSPRKAVWMTSAVPTRWERGSDAFAGRSGWNGTRLVNLQDRQERLLRDLDRSYLLHPLLSFFLLLEQLALARDVAPVAFGGHVLAQRADGLAGDHFGADRGLDHHLEQLARDQLLQLL